MNLDYLRTYVAADARSVTTEQCQDNFMILLK